MVRDTKRILVAMSGGIDSSCAAHLLLEDGYDVRGAFMRLWDAPVPLQGTIQATSENDAHAVADALEIPFFVYDFRKKFKERVITYFASEYAQGRTPNPCIVCNQTIKFQLLLDEAQHMGLDGVATGHYVRKTYDPATNTYLLQEGVDPQKDQSYFLFLLTQKQLAHLEFPLGGLTKKEVREIARAERFFTHPKPESQEICFIPDNKYSDFLVSACGLFEKEGVIKDTSGKVLGTHPGYFHYTIGQRRGIGVSAPHPLYVVRIDADANEVIVGKKEEALRATFRIEGVQWINQPPLEERVQVRVRYNQPKVSARIQRSGSSADIVLDEGEVITPGQAAVFYQGATVLGGGWIV